MSLGNCLAVGLAVPSGARNQLEREVTASQHGAYVCNGWKADISSAIFRLVRQSDKAHAMTALAPFCLPSPTSLSAAVRYYLSAVETG